MKYGQKSCGSILSSNKIVKFAERVEIKIALSKKLSSRKKLFLAKAFPSVYSASI